MNKNETPAETAAVEETAVNMSRNKLVECPEPGILFTRDNAMWTYHALNDARNNGTSIPEQDELCDELRGLLWPTKDRANTNRRAIAADRSA